MSELSILEILVIISFFLIIYTFLLYPFLVYLLSIIYKKEIKTEPNGSKNIAVVIAAYNEEDTIEDAINSILDSNYPLDKTSIYIGLDGSVDNTYSIVSQMSKIYNNIHMFSYQRSGKNRTLNKIMENVTEDFIFFLDADLRVQPNTFHHLVSILQAEDVGGVMIPVIIINPEQSDTGSIGEIIYQKFDAFIRYHESLVFSTVNSLGTLYGIRKDAYSPIPNDRVCDDLFRVFYVVSLKKRFIFDKKFSVFEVRKKSLTKELNRRIRLASGGLSTLWEMKEILLPKYGLQSLFVLSHKLLRWLTPIFLIIFLLSNIFINSDSFLFLPLLNFNLYLYSLAFAGWVLEKAKIHFFPFKIFLFFVSMNIGFLLGIIRFLSKKQNAQWDRNKLDSEINSINVN